jgi:Type I restriction enzyme R protein N terminus (HSDR_N)
MQELNLPSYEYKIKKNGEKIYIFDNYRKKYVVLTPEEWVRQNFMNFLSLNLNYPSSLIVLEHELIFNGIKKRCDAVVYDTSKKPLVILEFKAPSVPINNKTFEQIAVYNKELMVDYLILSNGLNHYCMKLDSITNKFSFTSQIPKFTDL